MILPKRKYCIDLSLYDNPKSAYDIGVLDSEGMKQLADNLSDALMKGIKADKTALKDILDIIKFLRGE